MRTLRAGTLTVTCYDAMCYLHETTTIKMSSSNRDVKSYVIAEEEEGEAIAVIAGNSGRQATIDVYDYLAKKGVDFDEDNLEFMGRYVELYIRENIAGGNEVCVDCDVYGLMNPRNVVRPAHPLDELFHLPLPSVVLGDFYFGSMLKSGLTGTFYLRVGSGSERQLFLNSWFTAYSSSGYQDGNVATIRRVVGGVTTETHTFCKGEVGCNLPLMQVRWIDRFGYQKIANFAISKLTREREGDLRLISKYDYYRGASGASDSMTLYMPNLNAYDYWYYSDVVTAPRVQVMEPSGEWRGVEVVTKKVVVPDIVGETEKLEFSIKYKEYEKIAL